MCVNSPRTRRTLTVTALLMISFGRTRDADAAGVVGTGSPASCTESALGLALVGGGLVTFNCGASPVTISLAVSGETISLDTTVDGGGLITIDSTAALDNVFTVDAGTLTVENLTLVNADVLPDVLATIGNSSTLVVKNCALSNDSFWSIFNFGGSVTVTNTTFTGGAGAYFEGSHTGTNSIDGSTFANAGTGVRSLQNIALTNSTFAGNVLGIIAGGSTVVLTNDTFSDDQTAIDGSATLINTIVAGSSVANCTATVVDGGHNLEDGTLCGFSAISSLSSTSAGFDPAGLTNNGGPTQTIALLSTSAAVDGGDDAVCSASPVNGLDQRGFARPGTGHSHCSVGAYEFYLAATPSPTPTEIPTATRTATASGTPTPTDTPPLVPLIKLQCMNGGWRTFSVPRTFKNQGDCIRFVNTAR
jgi:hypothetical protein